MERIARIARLAEERAEKRAAERKTAEEAAGKEVKVKASTATSSAAAGDAGARTTAIPLSSKPTDDAGDGKVRFRTKEQRQQEALARLEQKRLEVRVFAALCWLRWLMCCLAVGF